jgi:hypothetical protein
MDLVCNLLLVLTNGLFLSDFPTKILYTFIIFPMHTTCPYHLILLELIILIILSKIYALQIEIQVTNIL